MVKTAQFTYGPIDILTSIVPSNVIVRLLDNHGNVSQELTMAYGDTSMDITVPAGTGWTVQALNKATDSSTIGEIVNSAPFDVIETQTVQIVTGITVV